MRDDAETVTARRESKKMAPYEVSGRKLDREAAAVVSPLQQGHGCASGDVKAYSPRGFRLSNDRNLDQMWRS